MCTWHRKQWQSTGNGAGRLGDPCVMVIFGASGDLTRRKLIPFALQPGEVQPAVARLCGDWGRAEPDVHRRISRQAGAGPQGIREAASRPRTAGLAQGTCLLHYRRVWRRQHLPAVERTSAESRHGTRHPRQLLLLSGHRAGFLWSDRGAVGFHRSDDGRESSVAEGDCRKALRTRPGFGARP